uniref:Uncharacterized protein n=1 Tax=Romanomermis culicivorax TaxID=13658 RepID=A0A915KHV1_ROMCU
MMTPRPQMQPMMVGPAPMMGAPYMMQQPPMVGQSLYPFPTNQQYDDYDKKDDEDDEDEYVKPLKVGQVGLSFGIKGVHEPGATGESGATTQFPLGDMLSGMMGGVAKIVQADAQKEMMGNMMKMMMLSSLVDIGIRREIVSVC